jgi:hypothetical protein
MEIGEVMNNQAFKKESAQGRANEEDLRLFVERNYGWSIDGKQAYSRMGIKYSASYSDLKDNLLSNLNKSVHWDFVFESVKDGKIVPIFFDAKSTGVAHKDFTEIALKSQCFKNKFEGCEIYLIYHGLQGKYDSQLNKLVDTKLIDGYSSDGINKETFEHIMKNKNIKKPLINEFFDGSYNEG